MRITVRLHNITIEDDVNSNKKKGMEDNIKMDMCVFWGHAVAWWLRHYVTNRKVAGSISDEVIF
jgi:hypothetical protein